MNDLIDDYRITGTLGAGAMGTVHRAEHVLLGRPVALKLLARELVGDQDMVRRFFHEARAVSSIRHPGIVEVFDFGFLDDGGAYFAMELLTGETLGARLARRGTLPEVEALAIVRGIASALAAAHAAGVVHRDVKPDNVFLVPDDAVPGGERVKLLDFGIAKLSAGAPTDAGSSARVMGTPTYMAPEQCRGDAVDPRADLYSLGCVLFELLTGRAPFEGFGLVELLLAHQDVAPPSLHVVAPWVSPLTAALVATLLEKRAERRVSSARALVGYLDRWTDQARARSAPSTVAMAG